MALLKAGEACNDWHFDILQGFVCSVATESPLKNEPSVLDVCVDSAREHVRDLDPLGAQLPVKLKELGVLVCCPWCLGNIWREYVVPSVTALPGISVGHVICDELPVSGAELVDDCCEGCILLGGEFCLSPVESWVGVLRVHLKK